MFLARLVAIVLIICLVGSASVDAVLPPDEVEALQAIGRTLRKTNWNFSVDPCSRSSGWFTQTSDGNENAVDCDCTFQNNTVCHVVNITLKSQDLTGLVPREIVRLPFLQSIDLTRNYLNGTIPAEWGSMNLTRINLLGNRISGSIPKEIANLSSLTEMVVESNQLTGTIPPEFGNLPRIQRLLFSSNNLTGEVPETLAKLITLTDLRLNDNNFNGSIPNFIQNWTKMERLEIQASGLSGPIPPVIASLTALTNLRISDLTGNQSTNFPPSLNNLTNLQQLILRSCNIVGQLPSDLGSMTQLKLLDLSFNKLSGPIPDSYSDLAKTDIIYLTGNSLNGTMPAWMLKDGEIIDLSYNNFTDDTNLTSQNSGSTCSLNGVNLFASSKENTSGIISCLRGFQCPRNLRRFVHINCGGGPVTEDKVTTYEEDLNAGGPSNFFRSSSSYWGFSSTGHFLNDDRPSKLFIIQNSSSIAGENPHLYMTARLSPLSLTYYGFCLSNGNYTVNLHFAEITFSSGNTFRSLGRRIFDVYIQGKLVLKDFNIENEAGGVNRGIIKNFTAVVTDNTINIRLHWAGKGTYSIPYRGVYGPLISAISVVDPNYIPPRPDNGNSFSTGAIVGIVIGVISAVLLFVVIIWWKGCFKREDTLENELKGLDLHTGSFTLRQIKAATNNFDPVNKIGEGGFGPVYKGLLLDGTIIAVKQLSSKSKQGNREFVNEIGMISALQNPHLVKLYGCCIEGNQLLLVYEYLENNSLARALFGPEEHQLHLDWPTRQKINIGIARGLAYLHEESRLKIVHRDIKATNVLLDKNLMPKISDFGLAKLDEEDNTHISTRIAGTYGYMAPEYAMHGYLTDKADVYSFGVVLLEVVCGRSNSSIKPKEQNFYLLDWANSLKAQGKLMELVDPRLGSNFNKKEVTTAINLALLCTNAVSAERPSMSSVVSILEGKAGLDEFYSNSIVSTEKTYPKEMEDEYSKGQGTSMDVPWTASTASTSDLYPILVDTEYWEKRDQQ